jgi:hypothetical protein
MHGEHGIVLHWVGLKCAKKRLRIGTWARHAGQILVYCQAKMVSQKGTIQPSLFDIHLLLLRTVCLDKFRKCIPEHAG